MRSGGPADDHGGLVDRDRGPQSGIYGVDVMAVDIERGPAEAPELVGDGFDGGD
ncbi:hypothetical protein D3C84_1317570 [compost metagenome]